MIKDLITLLKLSNYYGESEYIEIAKDYSSQKSSFFINGVLDKILKQYNDEGKIKKMGRGLL